MGKRSTRVAESRAQRTTAAGTPPPPWARDRRVLLFALLVAACVTVAIGYVGFAAIRSRDAADITTGRYVVAPSLSLATPAPGPTTPPPTMEPGLTQPPAAVATPREVLFQNVIRDANYARVAVVPADDPDSPRAVADLTCERVYARSGRGLCLVPEQGLITRYYALVFDAGFRTTARTELAGAPSRARVSADARYGAATVFVFGHSYADGNFSTQTTIIDLEEGATVAELETFHVYRDDELIANIDFNFWGVTFDPTDSDHFYATLRTQEQTYLVEGSVSGREMRVIHDDVECPSLSPDGTRIAFKKRTDALIPSWRLTVLDLASMTETPLAETRSVDDQAEWLGNDALLYAQSDDLWTVPADGTGAPRMYLEAGLSPAVQM